MESISLLIDSGIELLAATFATLGSHLTSCFTLMPVYDCKNGFSEVPVFLVSHGLKQLREQSPDEQQGF
jgi:hypothetical protein